MEKISADKILQRGIDLMKGKKFEEAENEFKRITQRDNAQYLRAQCYLIDIYIRSRQWIKVIKASKWILDNHCSDISKEEAEKIRFKLGCSYLRTGRWKNAVNIFSSLKSTVVNFMMRCELDWLVLILNWTGRKRRWNYCCKFRAITKNALMKQEICSGHGACKKDWECRPSRPLRVFRLKIIGYILAPE